MTLVVREAGRACVRPEWQGKTCVCIGGGPSLTEDALRSIALARAAGAVRVIAINDQYLVAPWADICYFADGSWWHLQRKGLERRWPWVSFAPYEVVAAMRAFRGQWVSIAHGAGAQDESVYLLRQGLTGGLSAAPDTLATGSNSGYQAINLAVHAGCRRVLLVGYDMRYDNGRSHSHNGHGRQLPEDTYHRFAERFHTLVEPLAARGVEVLNCTPGSRLAVFPRAELVPMLAQALAQCAPGA